MSQILFQAAKSVAKGGPWPGTQAKSASPERK